MSHFIIVDVHTTTVNNVNVILINYPDLYSAQTLTMEQAKVNKKNIRGADIAFVFLFQQERKSSRNGATEQPNRHPHGFPRVGTATHRLVETVRCSL